MTALSGFDVIYRIAWLNDSDDFELDDNNEKIPTYYLSRSNVFKNVWDAKEYIKTIPESRKPIIVEQINNTAPMLKEDTEQVVSILKAGKTTNDYPLALSSMFSKDIQPFMISWMAYNPTNIINSLNCPVLIVNGTKDLQVSVKEAELLKRANDNSNIVIIEKMNHVLIEIEGDDLENSKSYNESFRKISPTLIENITNFIKS